MNITRLQQIGFTLSLISSILSLLYLSIGEIAIILKRILPIVILLAVITSIYTCTTQRRFFRTPIISGAKIGAMLGWAMSTAAIAIGRSEVVNRLLYVLQQSQQTFADSALIIPALPTLLSVLAIVTGLGGLISIAVIYRATLVFGDAN
jgi:hypothetical protein